MACRERPSGGRVAFDPVRGIAPAGNALGRSGIPGRGAGGEALGAASPLRDGAAAISIVGAGPHARPGQHQEQSDKQRPHAHPIGPSAELLYALARDEPGEATALRSIALVIGMPLSIKNPKNT